MKWSHALVLVALLGPVLNACHGQKARGPEPSGAYSDASTESPEIQETAEVAVTLLRERTADESLALVSIERAETQVVAGKNTRLALVLDCVEGSKKVTVVVYRDLQGRSRLSEVDGL